MDVSIFLQLLCGLSVLSACITEGIKQFFKAKEHASYNLIAIIVGIIAGMGGSHVFYYLSDIGFANPALLVSILMGIATALSSMVGYDKVKQLIMQLMGK